jgi:hypothetical protein
MPGARFFFLSHVLLFVLSDGRAGRADYNPLRRAAVLPILPGGPLFVLLHKDAAPQHVGFRVRDQAGAKWALLAL